MDLHHDPQLGDRAGRRAQGARRGLIVQQPAHAGPALDRRLLLDVRVTLVDRFHIVREQDVAGIRGV